MIGWLVCINTFEYMTHVRTLEGKPLPYYRRRKSCPKDLVNSEIFEAFWNLSSETTTASDVKVRGIFNPRSLFRPWLMSAKKFPRWIWVRGFTISTFHYSLESCLACRPHNDPWAQYWFHHQVTMHSELGVQNELMYLVFAYRHPMHDPVWPYEVFANHERHESVLAMRLHDT